MLLNSAAKVYSESPLRMRRNERDSEAKWPWEPIADVCDGAEGFYDPSCGHLCGVGQKVLGGALLDVKFGFGV